MSSTEETLAIMRREIWPLLETAMEGMLIKSRVVLDAAEQQRAHEIAGIADQRAKGLAEVAEERAKGLADVDAKCAELQREIAAMNAHKEAQEGHVELNIGGYRFETSVQTLRRLPHTFFDAYFSGRYAQDVCRDGSIFVDRDGEHFGYVLEYMRDGVVSVAEPGARPSVSLLRALKREFGFYCIELCVQGLIEPEQPEAVFVMGGKDFERKVIASMERYDVTSGQWSSAAAMGTARDEFGACVISQELYVTGGGENGLAILSSVEKYSPSSDTWSEVARMPETRLGHAAVSVGVTLYVLGGQADVERNMPTATVLKFDSTQGSWSEVAPMPGARIAIAACAIGSLIYVFGGYDGTQQMDTLFMYDTETNLWSTLASMPQPSWYHSVCVLDGICYVVGGGGGYGTFRFDPASGAWSTLASTSYERDFGTSFVLDGCLYAAGGGENMQGIERYDLANNKWNQADEDMFEGRSGFHAVIIGSASPAEERDHFDALVYRALKFHREF
jgi:hypothetical protein